MVESADAGEVSDSSSDTTSERGDSEKDITYNIS